MKHGSRINSRWQDGAAVLCIVILASLPFLQVSGFSFLNYDDPLHVSAQPVVLSGLNAQSVQWSMSATPSNLWHPLTWMSYMTEVSLFGGGADAAGVHHRGNLVLHLITTLLFFGLLRCLRISTVIAAVVALLFSLHPLHVEPVAWISSRKDVLYAAFAMASLCCYLKSKKSPWGVWFWLTLLTAAAAMTSKPSALVLPLLFVLLDYLRPTENLSSLRSHLRSQVMGKWPYLLLAGLGAVATVLVQYKGSHSAYMGEQSLLERLSYLPASLAFYVQHSLVPRHLTFEYAFPSGLRYGILTGVGVGLLIALGYLLWKKNVESRGWIVGFLWFIGCLAPVLGFFFVGSGFTADRYAYLALAGPALALAVFLESQRGIHRRGWLMLTVLTLLIFAALSYQQVGVWKNDTTLFTHGVAVEPGSGTAQTNLASLYRQHGRDDLALVHYQKALRLEASHYIVHYNIARIHEKRGERAEAMVACRQSLRSNPNYARSLHLLGQLLDDETKHSEEAFSSFESAYRLNPGNARFAISHALAHARRKQYQSAYDVLMHALNIGNPSPTERQKIEDLLVRLHAYLENDSP